jgi:hypothetical protein
MMQRYLEKVREAGGVDAMLVCNSQKQKQNKTKP